MHLFRDQRPLVTGDYGESRRSATRCWPEPSQLPLPSEVSATVTAWPPTKATCMTSRAATRTGTRSRVQGSSYSDQVSNAQPCPERGPSWHSVMSGLARVRPRSRAMLSHRLSNAPGADPEL
jgi:hypothetical protein